MSSIADRITDGQRAIITLAALLTTTMVQIDTTVANVALPDIQASLAAAPDQIGWVITSYMVAAAIGMPLAGALFNYVGFRGIYLACITGFGVSSLLCGLATSLPELALFRILQGLSGAIFVPMMQTLLLDIYPPHKLGKAMGIVGLGTLGGPVIGPSLGGYLTDEVGWRWIFFMNLPIAAGAFLMMATFMPRATIETRQRRFDGIGFGMLALALACAQLMFDRGPGEDWFESTEIIIYALVAGLMLYVFLVHSAYRKHPFFDLDLFRDRNYTSTLVLSFALGISMYGPLTLVPLFLQTVQHHDAFQTGMIMVPRALAMAIPMMLVGRLVNVVDPRLLIFTGLSCAAVGLAMLRSLTPDSPASQIITAGCVQSFGIGMSFVPMNLLGFATLAPHLRAMGSSLTMLVRSFGASMSIAFMLGYLSDSTDGNYLRLAENLSPFNPNMSGPGLPAAWSLENLPMLKLMMLETARQASVIAYNNIFLMLSLCTVATLPLVAMLGKVPKTRPLPSEPVGEIG